MDVKDHDDRVVPAHSFKFAATMQENQKGNNPVLIKIETKSGYGAGMSTKQKKEEVTYIWSCMFYLMGIRPKYKIIEKKALKSFFRKTDG